MAAGILSLLDDVAALMDDVATASKIATRKTAGILGDDLAVNAEKATGFLAQRELPVLWAITKGSFLNKLIIIPVALLLSAIWPIAITIILVGGGVYLAYEGIESIFEFLFHRVENKRESAVENIQSTAERTQTDAPAEKIKIRSAVTTDFVLSVEIVIIALVTVLDKTLPIRILTVTAVSVIATVGVYGIVAIIVRMDDWGYRLLKRSGERGPLAIIGRIFVRLMPMIIKVLRVVGTVALLLVSGGIFVHNIIFLHHVLPDLPSILRELMAGLIVGLASMLIVMAIKKFLRTLKPAKAVH